MNYQAFTNESLTMMYEAVRGALGADDALVGQGEEPKFRVRQTPEWKTARYRHRSRNDPSWDDAQPDRLV